LRGSNPQKQAFSKLKIYTTIYIENFFPLEFSVETTGVSGLYNFPEKNHLPVELILKGFSSSVKFSNFGVNFNLFLFVLGQWDETS